MAESTNTAALHQGLALALWLALAQALWWNGEAPCWAESSTAPREAQKSRTWHR